MAQTKDSLKVALKDQTFREVRQKIDSIIDIDKKIELKKELGEIMREARKPE